jgi:uncharacterized protein (DUF2062 family)
MSVVKSADDMRDPLASHLAAGHVAARDAARPSGFSPVVVAPTHNNRNTLEDIIARVRATGLALIVVNDGSTDDTAAVLASPRWAGDGGVTVITHPHNRGKAAALRTAFGAAAAAGFTHAATVDTDGQLEPEQIPGLLALARSSPHALVIGRRDENTAGYPAKNRFGRRLSNLFVWMESGVRVSDSQCGLRVYPLDFVNAARCRSGRYGFETEIITRAGWAGLPVVEAPVRCHYFPKDKAVSHFRPWADTFRAIGMHGRLMLRALSPFTRRRKPAGELSGSARAAAKPWRHFAQWINPVGAWRQLRADDTGRATAAAGLAIGAFIANLPAYGFQTVLSLYAARRLHLHPVAVVAGSQLSTPPVGPVLVAAAIAVGHVLLHGRLPALAEYRAAIAQGGAWRLLGSFLLEWTLGALIVGFVCACVTFAVANRLFRLAARDEQNDAAPGGDSGVAADGSTADGAAASAA